MAQADGNRTCLNCGGVLIRAAESQGDPFPEPESPVSPDSLLITHARRDSWQRPAGIVAVVLFLLAGAVLLAALRKPTAHALLPTPPKIPSPVSAPLLSAAAMPSNSSALPSSVPKSVPPGGVPLTITLVSAAGQRHVKVGEGVRLTTFTNLTPGQGASLTLTYRRNSGRNTLFSFAQGSLSSTTWTPFAPGHYDFLATALDDHQQVAAARHLQITVDPAPAAETLRLGMAMPADKVRPSLLPGARTQSPLPKPLHSVAAAKRFASPNSSPFQLYVAAAHFPFEKSALVLADALGRRGYHAVSERMADGHRKAVYVVVTGSYSRPENARQQILILKRSGYPAYCFRSR